MNPSGIVDIAHSIQLAVAPVFLLSAVGVFLTVLTNRLARIIDRARLLERSLPTQTDTPVTDLHQELIDLAKRAHMVQISIALATICALMICLVIVSLFAGVALHRNVSNFIVILFVTGLSAFIGALLVFLLEIQASIKSLRLGDNIRGKA